MFGSRRRESERERTLLAVIRNQDAKISELLDRLADAHGRPWTLPPRPPAAEREEKPADPVSEFVAL